MPVNPADSPILGTLYGSDAMRAVFDETAYFQRMLDVEAALARVQGRLGIIPTDAAATIIAAAKVENLSNADLAASARNVGYPVVGLVAGHRKPPATPGPGRIGAPPPRTSWTPPPCCRSVTAWT